LNTIEIECNAILKQFNFKYNTADTRAAIIQILTPVLSVIQTSGAIDSYTITCDETNNTAEVIENDFGIVDIGVTFNHGMEKILTRITINRYSSDSDSDSE
jgi:phage tail sheath protein FI